MGKEKLTVMIIGILLVSSLSACQSTFEQERPRETYISETETDQIESTFDAKEPALINQVNEEREETSYFVETGAFEGRAQEWLERNPDYVGWITVQELGISEPVVRGDSNQEYLRKDIDGNYRKAGTIFMDYRNIGNDFDDHIILYGHNLKDDQMFGPLRAYLDAESLVLPEIEYESLYGREAYKVFSVYRVSADDYAYKLVNDKSYVQLLIERSEIQTSETLLDEKKILTLSTCSYEEKNERLVVHAYLMDQANE